MSASNFVFSSITVFFLRTPPYFLTYPRFRNAALGLSTIFTYECFVSVSLSSPKWLPIRRSIEPRLIIVLRHDLRRFCREVDPALRHMWRHDINVIRVAAPQALCRISLTVVGRFNTGPVQTPNRLLSSVGRQIEFRICSLLFSAVFELQAHRFSEITQYLLHFDCYY